MRNRSLLPWQYFFVDRNYFVSFYFDNLNIKSKNGEKLKAIKIHWTRCHSLLFLLSIVLWFYFNGNCIGLWTWTMNIILITFHFIYIFIWSSFSREEKVWICLFVFFVDAFDWLLRVIQIIVWCRTNLIENWIKVTRLVDSGCFRHSKLVCH